MLSWLKSQDAYANFPDDKNVVVMLDTRHKYSKVFAKRKDHEVIFRKINTYLIDSNIIRNNVIDLGAWIGDNSIPWSKNIHGTVYAIDPSSENCDFINHICKLNNIHNVKTLQYAISDKEELLSTEESSNHVSFNTDNIGIYKVTSKSLDYLLDNNVIEDIGYIHLDVEGMEFKVIKGSTKLIEKYKPIITFEQHLEIDDYKSLISYMSNNYTVYMINEVLLRCRPDCRNFIAFPHYIDSSSLIKDITNTLNIPQLFTKF